MAHLLQPSQEHHDMIRRHQAPRITAHDPWAEDIFERKDEGLVLASLIATSTNEPITISLQSPWGSGKTVFLSRIAQHVRSEERIPVIMIDAWKTDYNGDPLVPILSELISAIEDVGSKTGVSHTLTQHAKATISAIADIGAKYILPGAAIAADIVTPGTGALAQAGGKLAEKILRDQQDRKKAEPLFADAITSARDILTRRDETRPIKPILVIIDELDRCRPDYAILTLERIKHYFHLPGIVFLIATDHGNLPSAVKTVYGEHVDGEGYLRKFFDYEFHLRPASAAAFATELVRSSIAPIGAMPEPLQRVISSPYNAPNFIDHPAFESITKSEYAQYFADMSAAFDLSPRDQAQAFTILTCYLNTLRKGRMTLPVIDCFVACLRFGHLTKFRELAAAGSITLSTGTADPLDRKISALQHDCYFQALSTFFSEAKAGKHESIQEQLKRHLRTELERGQGIGMYMLSMFSARLDRVRKDELATYATSIIRLSESLTRTRTRSEAGAESS